MKCRVKRHRTAANSYAKKKKKENKSTVNLDILPNKNGAKSRRIEKSSVAHMNIRKNYTTERHIQTSLSIYDYSFFLFLLISLLDGDETLLHKSATLLWLKS